MRTKTIIVGAIAALALATLSANAGNAPQRHTTGSAKSLVAGTAAIAKANRDEVSAAVRTASTVKTTTTAEAAEKPEVEDEDEAEAPEHPVSAACQAAIDNLKALRRADVAEDAAEKAARHHPPTDAEIAADKAEDKAEAEHLRDARQAVRAACLPQPSAACQTAIDNLKALRKADVAEDAAEKAARHHPPTDAEIAADKVEDMAEAQALRAAFTAVRAACGGDRD